VRCLTMGAHLCLNASISFLFVGCFFSVAEMMRLTKMLPAQTRVIYLQNLI
jgi:hypothetical protein